MIISQINENIIKSINNGDEKAFSLLYNYYYSYLRAVAVYYVFNKDIAGEIVNDVFINVWNRRKNMTFPIHSYLVRSVQNGCLNYHRQMDAYKNMIDKHKDQMLDFQEKYISSTPEPLQFVEINELKTQIETAVAKLPKKRRSIFEKYYFEGMSPDKIAQLMNLNINTVRVQLKNSLDRLKKLLK